LVLILWRKRKEKKKRKEKNKDIHPCIREDLNMKYYLILGVVKRNSLFLHEIEWKNNGFLFEILLNI